MSIKKWCAVFLIAALLCPVLGGCGRQETAGGSGAGSGAGKTTDGSGAGSAAEEKTDGDAAVSEYEYVFREIGEQKYIEPAESFAGGTGTEGDPYQISNAAELALLGEVYEILADTDDMSDERVAPYFQANYVLTDDIVINERADGEDWSKTPPEYAWMPIGFHRYFEGVFDGAGHTVSGLYINADVIEKNASNGNCFGLFGENGGTIKNVILEKSYICVAGYTSCVGGIAGSNRPEDHSIENCAVSADLGCYDSLCGGVVGENFGAVKDCAFSGTVTCQREDGIGSCIGGIAGSGDLISGCKNSGDIRSANTEGNTGGIAGKSTGVTGCENTGSVTGGQAAGGIVGGCSLMGGGNDPEDTRAEIVNCKNSGTVFTDGGYAGGIAGTCGIDYSDDTVTVSGCENSGSVGAKEKIGGVIGLVALQGEGGVTISDCINNADLNGEVAGGIIGSASELFGTLTVSDCKNSGEISGSLYGAGIAAENNLMTWDEDKAYPLNVTISGCENTGAVSTARGGGVAGVFVSSIPAEYGGRVTITLEGDSNQAGLHSIGSGSFLGGIAGNVGVANGTITVKDCRTSGIIDYPEPEMDEETAGIKADEFRLELSRIGGGIVGMVDSGIFLATNNDGKDGTQVNNPDAKIVFSGCHSDMTFVAPDEDEYVYDDDGAQIFYNRFGGVLGFCSDDAGLAFWVEDCTYTGCDRGLGNTELPDVGTKQ